MKKALYFLFICFMTMTMSYSTIIGNATSIPISVTVNGKVLVLDQSPVSENGRILVPLRAIFEELGAQVDWDDATKTITSEKGNTSIKLVVGNTTALVDDNVVQLDVPAKIINGRTLVPTRFIAESLGTVVNWKSDTRVVEIDTKISSLIVDEAGPNFTIDAQDKVKIDNSINYWEGKKIVWFGTSIPEGGYPQKIGNNLNAFVFNDSKGSSSVRSGDISRTTEDDIYGWTGLGWKGIAFALSGTLEEKYELINNWDIWKTKLTGSPPDKLDEETKKLILSTSYEKRLVERHLGEHKADLYVFDHGYNDRWNGGADMTTMPINSRDRRYYLGAMNYLIDIILEDNPHARILFIGHYENDKYPEIAEAQLKLAEYWGFPIIKLWEETGWSQQLIKTTGYWEEGVWIPNGGPSRQINVLDTWLADSVHPHSDKSGQAINLIAEIITAELQNIR